MDHRIFQFVLIFLQSFFHFLPCNLAVHFLPCNFWFFQNWIENCWRQAGCSMIHEQLLDKIAFNSLRSLFVVAKWFKVSTMPLIFTPVFNVICVLVSKNLTRPASCHAINHVCWDWVKIHTGRTFVCCCCCYFVFIEWIVPSFLESIFIFIKCA